nr:hypothetical protein [uncultured Caproiciproducens sp.]
MKKKTILLLAITIFIIFTFVGCRYLPGASSTASGSASSGMNLNSAVSGVVSKVESDAKGLGSQVSGVVSQVESGSQQLVSQASGTVSAITSSK